MSHIIGKVYDLTQANMQKIIEELDQSQRELEACREMLEVARKALEFYAMGDYKYGPTTIQVNLVKLMHDDGKLAREAIAKIGDGK
jgi:hypothetical protein